MKIPYDEYYEMKAEAIALITAGKSNSEVRASTGLGYVAILKLRKELSENPEKFSYLETVKERLGDMIAESLTNHLSAMNKIAEVASDETYIRGESAKDIAELHSRLEQWTLAILQASNSITSQGQSGTITVHELPEPEK